MILHPAVISLMVSSLLIAGLVLFSAMHAFRIARSWNIASGSELQLTLERRTYLVSTILAYVFAFQLASLFLYVYTADHLCTLFTGAMCAAGTLAVNGYGYPVLLLKIVNFFGAGLWLMLNHADSRAYDYPLTRIKYLLLLVIVPLIVAEAVLQAAYFLNLHPGVITSCCGSLFAESADSVSSDLASLPPLPVAVVFFGTAGLAASSGILFLRTGRGGVLFASLSGLLFPAGILSILSFISLYLYELPTHHCPFCLVQKEYGWAGYPLYAALFGTSLAGAGVGVLMPFRRVPSLSEVLPKIQKKMAIWSVGLAFLLCMLVLILIMRSNLRLIG